MQYGDNALPKTTVFRWINLFKKGQTSVSDSARSGRPVTSSADVNIAAVQELIQGNRRISIMEIAKSMDISYGSVFGIIHKKLKTNLKPTFRTKRRSLLTEGVLPQHNSATPHIAHATEEYI